MKRAALTIFGTIAGLAMLLGFKTQPLGATLATGVLPGNNAGASSAGNNGNGNNSQAAQTSGSGSGSGSTGSSSSSGSGGSTSTTTSSTRQTVTGAPGQTPFGPVQVQVTSAGGRIVDVKILQAPWGTGTDQQINSYALPILIRETINAQSATIDMVSGATYTSHGYTMSLQSALDQLHA